MRTLAGAVVIGVVVLLGGASSIVRAEPATSEWREDLRFLAREVPRRHKNAFHTVSREAFERSVAELDRAIPEMAEHEILVGMMRITASIGDAHTTLEEPRSFHRYPMSLYWFGDELRVVLTTEPYRRALGAKVVEIGGARVAEAARRVEELIPRENEYWVKYLSGLYLPYVEMLHATKVTPEVLRGAWTFEADDGERLTLEMEAKPRDVKNEWISVLKEPPLHRQRSDEAMWFTTLDEGRVVYLNFRSYPDAGTLKRVAGELFEVIDGGTAKRLVIDVRLNRGGDFIKGRLHLLAPLRERAGKLSGGIYVVTGRATQSAAMVNALDARKELGAMLIGEPTGGRPNGYSENDSMVLPHSKVKVSYSTRLYRFQDEDTPAVMPDVRIDPEWAAYREGRYPVLEWILKQPME